MHEFEIKPELLKHLQKLSKKDRVLYEVVMKKIDEIISCGKLDHYKNLRKPMNEYQRVHVRSSFVLIFKEEEEKILFCDLDHHDKIYK